MTYTGAMFKLKCVGCQDVVTRPAEECAGDDVSYCEHCYMPMVLVEVVTRTQQQRSTTWRSL